MTMTRDELLRINEVSMNAARSARAGRFAAAFAALESVGVPEHRVLARIRTSVPFCAGLGREALVDRFAEIPADGLAVVAESLLTSAQRLATGSTSSCLDRTEDEFLAAARKLYPEA